ncbi:hypothetical protein PoB_002154900 [Plakobranchus ocellatus]|uniref:Uncharacterized protein n=1 Tax=Plakobranchus ocellatus TaxID=259542 RepID=A0AAV3ZKZ4_9GAST|nr:hypothetical protein PoB_002154900 [Plakobranchus ocellatus]
MRLNIPYECKLQGKKQLRYELKTAFLHKDGRPGYDWTQGFLSRHADIASKKIEQLSTTRSGAEDPEVLNHGTGSSFQIMPPPQSRELKTCLLRFSTLINQNSILIPKRHCPGDLRCQESISVNWGIETRATKR